MAYLPDAMPLPNTEEIDTKEFWQHIQNRDFVVQQCSDCGTFTNPPGPICYNCRSFNHKLTQVEGKGQIYSYIICVHPVHPALVERGPYNVAIIELPEVGGVRFVGNILDAADEELYVGMPVKVTFEERGGVVMPQWLKA
jgi:uncharacterized protein